VIIHQFGSGTSSDPDTPWLPCPKTLWCAEHSGFKSASIINAAMRLPTGALEDTRHSAWRIPLYVKNWEGAPGIVYAPAVVRINCACSADCGSMRGGHAGGLPGCQGRDMGSAGNSLEDQMLKQLKVTHRHRPAGRCLPSDP